MDSIEVFADVSCPFAHVGFQHFVAERARRGLSGPLLRVRPWPLELVNGAALTGPGVVPKVEALRSQVARDLFAGFAPERFPTTTLPVLAAEAAAYATDPQVGERFSWKVRHLLFEEGVDPSTPSVLDALLAEHEVDAATVDPGAPDAGWREGAARGVVGSPYFFVDGRGWFCPSLHIAHDDHGYDIEIDAGGWDEFRRLAFPDRPAV